MKEIWKDIPGYVGSYQVSNLGNVRSVDRWVPSGRWASKRFQPGKILSEDVTHRGYATVILSKKGNRQRKEIHTLVALVFLGKRPAKHHVHHKDHNSLNNKASNLIYIQNGEHSRYHHSGEGCYKAKLTNKDVMQIRKRLAQGEYQKDIAKDYGVARSTIGEIKRGASWNCI